MLLGESTKTKVYEGTQRQQFSEIIQILGISSQRNIVGDNKKKREEKRKSEFLPHGYPHRGASVVVAHLSALLGEFANA